MSPLAEYSFYMVIMLITLAVGVEAYHLFPAWVSVEAWGGGIVFGWCACRMNSCVRRGI